MSDRTRKAPDTAPVPAVKPAVESPTLAFPDNSVVMEKVNENAAYTNAFGNTVGGFLFDQVDKNLSAEKIDGHATDLFGSAADWIGGKAVEVAEPGELEAANAFKDHLGVAFREGYGGMFADSDLGENVEGFAKDNPWTMGTLGLLGLGAYIASDQDLKFDTDIGLGKRTDLELGADLGSTLHPGIDAVRGGISHESGANKYRMFGEYRFDRPEWSVGAQYSNSDLWGGRLNAEANWKNADGRDLANAGVSFRNEDFLASLSGKYDSEGSHDGDKYGELNARFRTLNERGPVWDAGAMLNTEGAWNVNAGVTHKVDENLDWFAKGHAGQNRFGDTDVGAQFGLSYKF